MRQITARRSRVVLGAIVIAITTIVPTIATAPLPPHDRAAPL